MIALRANKIEHGAASERAKRGEMPVDPAAVVRLREQGWSWADTAGELKCSVAAARRAAAKAAGPAAQAAPSPVTPRQAAGKPAALGVVAEPRTLELTPLLKRLVEIAHDPRATVREQIAATRLLIEEVTEYRPGQGLADYLITGAFPSRNFDRSRLDPATEQRYRAAIVTIDEIEGADEFQAPVDYDG